MSLSLPADPGPDVIQVVLAPRNLPNQTTSFQAKYHVPHALPERHGHIESIPNSMDHKPKPLPVLSSIPFNGCYPQLHQLRELVRERLISEDIRLSAPPYTIPKVRDLLSQNKL